MILWLTCDVDSYSQIHYHSIPKHGHSWYGLWYPMNSWRLSWQEAGGISYPQGHSWVVICKSAPFIQGLSLKHHIWHGIHSRLLSCPPFNGLWGWPWHWIPMPYAGWFSKWYEIHFPWGICTCCFCCDTDDNRINCYFMNDLVDNDMYLWLN